MSIDSPATDSPPPRRKRRRFARLLLYSVLALLALAAAGSWAIFHLTPIARWVLERTFPGARIEIHRLRVTFPNRLDVDSIVLKSRKDNDTLLKMDGGTVIFNFTDLWHRQLGEVRLNNPVIAASPKLMQAFAPPPGTPAKKEGSPWSVRRLVCDGGELTVADYGLEGLTLHTKFCFDLYDFSPVNNPLATHTFILWDTTATSGSDPSPILSLVGCSISFSFDGLTRHQFGELAFKKPKIVISPERLKALALPPAKEKDKTEEEAPATPWSIQRISTASGEIAVTGYGLENVNFATSFCFDFRDFAPSGSSPTPETITFWDTKATSSKDAAQLFSLAGCSVTFSFAGLKNHEVDDLAFKEPKISLSQERLKALSPPASKPKDDQPASTPWKLRHFSAAYGEAELSDYGPRNLTLSTKFSFDINDLSSVSSTAPQSINLWQFSAATGKDAPFVTLMLVTAKATMEGLLKNHSIDSVSLNQGSLVVGDSLRNVLASSKGNGSAAPAEETTPWKIGSLNIQNVLVRLDDDRPEVADITFALNTKLVDVPLTETGANLGSQEQVVRISNIEVLSPTNPLNKVFTLDSVAFRFTLSGLLHKEINQLSIVGPTIYVGEDLFWYMDDMEKRYGLKDAAASSAPGGPGWTIKQLDISRGRLNIGSGGRAQYGLPLNFHTTAENIQLDNLAALKLQGALEIPAQDYSFESYQLEVSSQKGELNFDYPPEKNQKNLVGKINLDSVRWRQYKAKKAWVSVTFDRQGINGSFGGQVYDGEAGGGFSFFFDADSPWIGWVYGKSVDLGQLTDIMAPSNFHMTGPASFKIQMNAQGKRIERLLGELHNKEPGKLKIGKLDDMLARIPDTWSLLKQSSTRIALTTLRDFDYTTATGNFWFVDSQGVLRLALQGPQGSRNFNVVLHANDINGRWTELSDKP